MASDHEKLTAAVVKLSSRPEIHESLRTVCIFSVLVAVWCGLRLYAMRVRGSPMKVEDSLFYISVASFYGMVVSFFLLLFLGGVGYHMDQLGKNHIARLTQTILAIQALYGLSMCTSKWSILWMLKRIFADQMFMYFTWAIIIVQAAWLIMTVLIGFLICRPVQKNWDPTAEGTCGNQIAGYTAVSVVNVIIDGIMCILPLPMIWRLHVKKPYKVALFGIFSIGVVSVIFAILRLLSLRSLDFDDFSYTVPEVITWTYAETGVIILVACSPLLRPIFDTAFRRFLSRASTDNSAPTPGGMRNYGSNKTHSHSKTRAGFMTVGDSQESLELGDLPPGGRPTKVSVTAGKMTDVGPWPQERGLQMGIMVEKETSQTVNLIDSMGQKR